MDKQNITLALPKDVLRKVKIIAIQEGSSVSGLLTRILEDMVARRDAFEAARRDHLTLLVKELNMGTEGKLPWRREELHAR